MSAPLCFVDIESDGVHPGRRPWEIALIRREVVAGVLFERQASFFVEIDLSTADPFGLRVGRFYERHPLGRVLSGLNDNSPIAGALPHYKSAWQAAFTVAEYTHGAHIVGAVPSFDTEVLSNLLREQKLTPAWHYHLIDIEALALGWIRGTGLEPPSLPWKSDDLMAALGIQPPAEEERHTALGDARWAMRTYDKVMGDRPW